MGNIASCFSNSNDMWVVAWRISIHPRARMDCLICAAPIVIWRMSSATVTVFMAARCTCCSIMYMRRQFPDRLLCCSMPTINRYIRLQVIVWIIRASVTNSYGMSMCTSLFGCFCALIRTPWSWSRFCTTCVVFFYKSKSMRVIPACTNHYIVVMFRQFSDRKIRKDW